MEKIILVVHILTALAIIGFVLLQRGKGAEAGASFGAGASQTVFGSTGSWNFFSKITAILATLFFVTSFGLAIIAKNKAELGTSALPALEESYQQQTADKEGDIPEVDTGSELDVPVTDETEASEIPADIPVGEPEQ